MVSINRPSSFQPPPQIANKPAAAAPAKTEAPQQQKQLSGEAAKLANNASFKPNDRADIKLQGQAQTSEVFKADMADAKVQQVLESSAEKFEAGKNIPTEDMDKQLLETFASDEGVSQTEPEGEVEAEGEVESESEVEAEGEVESGDEAEDAEGGTEADGEVNEKTEALDKQEDEEEEDEEEDEEQQDEEGEEQGKEDQEEQKKKGQDQDDSAETDEEGDKKNS